MTTARPAGMRWNPPPGWPDVPGWWTPEPGWQPDPAWGPAPAGWQFWVPTDAPPPPAPWDLPQQSGARVDDTWAWALALVPLLFIAFDAALYLSGVNDLFGIGLVAAFFVNTIFAIADERLLKRAGHDVSLLWALLLVPVYLLLRSKRLGRSQAHLAVWLASFVVYIAGSLAVERAVGIVYLDMQAIERSVGDDAAEVYGGPQEVDCPAEDTWRVGQTFRCDVVDAEGTAIWEVTVRDRDGFVTWAPVE
jgi:hypothetical protein